MTMTAETTPADKTATTPEEPKMDFASAAAAVWKEPGPAPEETITPSADEEPSGQQPAQEEKATPSAESPKDDRVAARLAAAKRAELVASRERETARSERAQLEAKAKELEAREKRIKVIEEDPVRFFEEFKQDPKTFLDKLAGEYKPEAVTEKKVKALEAELAQIREREAKREEETKAAATRAQADSAWKEASAAFVSHVTESATKYPSLVEEFSEAEASELAFRVLTETVGHDNEGRPISRTSAYYAEHGVYPDNDVVAEYLDSLAKQRIEARSKAGWRTRGESADKGSQPSGDPKPVPPVSGMSPRTLKARDASTRVAAPKPWSQEAADEESLRILSAALRRNA